MKKYILYLSSLLLQIPSILYGWEFIGWIGIGSISTLIINSIINDLNL